MNRKIYTEATQRALATGLSPEQVLSGLQKVLTRHGHTTLYPMILKDVLKSLEKGEKNKTVTVRVAKAGDADTYRTQIAQFVSDTQSVHTEVVVDETLIGGFMARTPHHMRDQSYKESLVSIYRALTAD